jgi:predicted DNA-binding protein (MmcQ/YjbR family)
MMDIESVRRHCLKKKGKVTEEFPFGEEILVFKIFGKIFVLANLRTIPLTINLKCDPERAIEHRERYDAVQPGYHMNKKMWNTVTIDGRLPDKIILEMIDHSYDETVKKLPKKMKEKVT